MKKYYAILSSIITAASIYVSVILYREIKEYIAYSFDSMKGFGMIALILLVEGFIAAWNLWMLKKSNLLSIIVSIIISIMLIIALYKFLLVGFLYPFMLLGAYGFMLINKIISKNNFNK